MLQTLPNRLCFGTLVLAASCLSLRLHAAPRAMTPVDYLSVSTFDSPRLSPDGTALLFLREDLDWKKDRLRTHLWLQRQNEDAAQQLTFERDDVSTPRWSPDGKFIAFLADGVEGSKNQIYLLPVAGGEAAQLTVHPTSVESITWTPDSSSLYYLAAEKKPGANNNEESLRNLITPFDSPAHDHLWKVQIASKKAARVTNGDFHVRSFDLSSDGQQLIVQVAPGAKIDDRHHGELMLIHSDGSNVQKVTNKKHEFLSPKLSPDGKHVLFLASLNEARETYFGDNMFLLALQDNQAAQLLIPSFPHEINQAAWGDDPTTIYFSANLGVHSQLFELKLPSMKWKQLTEGKHRLLDWHYVPSAGRLVMQLRTSENPCEFWLMSQRDGGKPARMTSLHESLSEEYAIPKQRAITWQAKDGQEIEGLLTLPFKFREGQSYPLIVQSHGGPRSSEEYGMWRWRNYRPVIASLGYVTLAPNYRGSIGYGDDFSRDMVGNYFRNAHQDVLDGVDHLIELGIADPERLGTMGWSAGGHMTNKLITATDRFKAASSGAGAVDWISMYGESDTRFNRSPWFGGSPWQKDAPLAAFLDQSPLKDMWRVTTPTLIFVGEKDERVPRTQSILLSRALTANGVPNQLYVAPGQGHDWRKPALRLFKINAELEWFERHLRECTYEWQERPAGSGD